MQSIPPLKVITDKVTYAARVFGISVDQLLGTEEVPMAELAWKYVPGNLLVRPEEVRDVYMKILLSRPDRFNHVLTITYILLCFIVSMDEGFLIYF